MASTDLSVEIAPELTDEQSMVVLALARGATRSGACSAAGVERWRFYEWLEKSPIFAQSCLKAEGVAEVGMSTVIARAAVQGDWRAAAFWLRTRRREQWRENVDVDVVRQIRAIMGELGHDGTGGIPGGAEEATPSATSGEADTSNPERSEDSNP